MKARGRIANIVGELGTENEPERDRWVREVLASLDPGLSLLDAGAGEGRYRADCSHLNYTSQDFSQYDGSGDTGLQTGTWDTSAIDIVSDITSIPVADGSFDVVLCTEVLEHVPRPLDALREMCRVLRPGGRLILTAPFNSMTHFAPYHYSTGFSQFFYRQALPEFGMAVDSIRPRGNYFAVHAQELRRLDVAAQDYSASNLRLLERIARAVLLRRLAEFSRADTGSSELNCYGFHVLALKHAESPNQLA